MDSEDPQARLVIRTGKKKRFDRTETASYIAKLTELVQGLEELEPLQEFEDSKVSSVFPFLTYTEEGGVLETLCVDLRSGFPDSYEITNIMRSYGRPLWPFMIDDERIEKKEKELAAEAAERLLKGEEPVQEQRLYRLIEFNRKVMACLKDGTLPDLHGLHETWEDDSVVLRRVEYNRMESSPVYWRITMSDAVKRGNGLSRLNRLWGGSNNDKKKPYTMVDSGDGKNPKRDSRLDHLISNASFHLDPGVLYCEIDEEFPETVQEVIRISFGPFYHRTIGNYHLFREGSIDGIKPLEQLEEEFGDDLSFVALRAYQATSGGLDKNVTLKSSNQGLDAYLRLVTFPQMHIVLAPGYHTPPQLPAGDFNG
ncbi:MAG: hypothetical protein KJ709_00185 [Nanoarchaeota archaeon]|nr:hypothetical protein [Nanoarchaeota archaeon]